MTVSIIVAVADNGIIGRGNALPWHLPDDLKWFKKTTMGRPLVMGRKTFDSIGRPLPGRANIVMTRDAAWTAEGVTVVHTFDQAMKAARHAAAESDIPEGEVMVIGGADVFVRALPVADRLYLTEVHQRPDGDVYFPPFDRLEWQEISRSAGQVDAAGNQTHEFVILQRRVTAGA